MLLCKSANERKVAPAGPQWPRKTRALPSSFEDDYFGGAYLLDEFGVTRISSQVKFGITSKKMNDLKKNSNFKFNNFLVTLLSDAAAAVEPWIMRGSRELTDFSATGLIFHESRPRPRGINNILGTDVDRWWIH